MRFSAALLLAVGLLCGLLQPSAWAAVALPSDLLVLEQKAAALRFNSDRLRLQVEVQSKEGLLGPGTPSLVFLIAGQGVESRSPEEASMTVGGVAGRHEMRVVGGALYTYEPSVARLDGGRPWVRSAKKPGQSLGGLGAGAPSSGDFASLLSLVGLASRVEETGPAIVDDQSVTEFTLTVGPLALSAWERLLGPKGGSLAGPGETPGSATLELFLAPSGLPVRQRFTLRESGATATFTTDILALEVPVSVQAPPARKTIGEARLRALQHRALERRRRRCRGRVCIVGVRESK